MKAGPEGVAAGEIARSLAITPNTLSAQLNVLSNAGLLASRRDRRSIIYTADYNAMGALLVYPTEDCCDGHPEVCGPLAEVACRAARCGKPKGALF